jgi:hypothetical protein
MHSNMKDLGITSQADCSQMRNALLGLVFAVFSVFAGSAMPGRAWAQPPELSLPVACDPGRTCWLVNLVDHDPGPGAQDYRCGRLSYDTHKGTDIAIANDAVMNSGVNVLAAAPGRVLRVRDGEPDSTRADLQSGTALRGRECGNGLLIDHGDGWTTQYCHMKAGSLTVGPGEQVSRGAVLGRIGRSGRTEFPHIHITLRRDKTVIDPFTGDSSLGVCDTVGGRQGLWAPDAAAALAYPGPQPFHLGFATGRPKNDDIEAGRLTDSRFGADVAALVFYAEVFSLTRGDRIILSLSAPDGSLIADNRVEIDRPLAKWHGFTGRKKRGDGWTAGTYTGRISVTRGGAVVEKSATAVVE